jgi:hypothetical protein
MMGHQVLRKTGRGIGLHADGLAHVASGRTMNFRGCQFWQLSSPTAATCAAVHLAEPKEIKPMQVQVNSNHTIQTGESMERWARTQLSESLSRYKGDITSIEVHMSDENSDKMSADHKRCMMEARLAHHEPIAVNHYASTIDEAFRGANQKLKHALEHAVGKLRDHRARQSIRRDPDLGTVGAIDI